MRKVNIVYDFDGTLTQTPLPRYLIIEKCGYVDGTGSKEFLEQVEKIKTETKCETMEAFYSLFFRVLSENRQKITKNDFYYGVDKIPFNKGLKNYFSNINDFAKQNNVDLNHYIITSGVKDFVEQCEYAKYFNQVFGCELEETNNFVTGVSYYLSTKEKIKKLNFLKDNAETSADLTIYVGDGLTDYYAMKHTNENGGKNIFVHQNENDLEIYNEVNKENIVDYCEIADYNKNSSLFNTICKLVK